MSASRARTGLVLVTHGAIGRSLIEVAEFILGESLSEVRFVPFRQSAMEETSEAEIRAAIDGAEQGQGVLVLTDICGASPFNTVSRLLPPDHAAMVNGVNLAMLVRAWSYRDLPPERLAPLAVEGGVRDIRKVNS